MPLNHFRILIQTLESLISSALSRSDKDAAHLYARHLARLWVDQAISTRRSNS